jgi:lipopolysaccharide transport system ATP-binding protein
MSDVMVKVDNLSKRYRIGAAQKGYKTFREAIVDTVTAPVRNFAKLRNLTRFENKDEEDVIWALKDVSFDVKKGEVLGVIGRNGSGKSTLLKIVSRITEPTSGIIEIHGRISSLLEVGTGFHPELTGRENIFLNGGILGMKKTEIENKFNDIVEFSEIGKFIDTPVKRYSSGMYVRLAFSVAAHLEPEILLVDEVLAVGDIAFQRKCLGKMEALSTGGRTVLFVSHNMGAIRSLCGSAIWLDNGRVVESGAADQVVRNYEDHQFKHLKEFAAVAERDEKDVKDRSFYLGHVELLNEENEPSTSFRYDEKLILVVDFKGVPSTRNYNLEFHIFNELDQLVSMGSSVLHGILLGKNTKKMRIEIGPLVLTMGKYAISLSIQDVASGLRVDTWEKCCSFDVTECSPFSAGLEMSVRGHGVFVLQQAFREIE